MAEETKKKEPHEEKPLEKMTVKELREIALTIPRSASVHDMKKAELVAFIREARGIKEESPVKKREKVVTLKMTKAELKAKIRQLKEAKLGAPDGKTAKALRHRISRLKKKSRKVGAV
jgi:hypothetical protein